jgi:MoaA/NifB/PqqE/SkfB family radical SAM enzyme
VPETGCVVPWSQSLIFPNGTVSPCCYWKGPVFGSLYESSFEDIWNGEQMRDLRAGLGRGKALPQCSKCWQEERGGVFSLRRLFNESYRAAGGSLEGLLAAGEASGYKADAPQLYFLNIGNLCNLKCRTCNEHCSSRIAADKVHSGWGNARLRPAWRRNRLQLAPTQAAGIDYRGFRSADQICKGSLLVCGTGVIEVPTDSSSLRTLKLSANSTSSWRLRMLVGGQVVRETLFKAGATTQDIVINGSNADRLEIQFEAEKLDIYGLDLEREPSRSIMKVVPPDAQPWFANIPRLVDMIGRNPEGVTLHVLGGEPFLNEETWALLNELVASGTAERIALVMSTNGTHQREDLARLAPSFRSVYLSVSIDGYGAMFEYLRYGARWDDLLRVLNWLRGLPNVQVAASTTMQNYNALDCVRLFRFFDSQGLPFLCHNVLMSPARLHFTNLPSRVRRIAAARLRGYMEADCRPERRQSVHSLVDLLESAGDGFDTELFREFMLFTNDLDASRKQRLQDAAPDLAALIAASGMAWTEALHHAEQTLRRPRNVTSFQRLAS